MSGILVFRCTVLLDSLVAVKAARARARDFPISTKSCSLWKRIIAFSPRWSTPFSRGGCLENDMFAKEMFHVEAHRRRTEREIKVSVSAVYRLTPRNLTMLSLSLSFTLIMSLNESFDNRKGSYNLSAMVVAAAKNKTLNAIRVLSCCRRAGVY